MRRTPRLLIPAIVLLTFAAASCGSDSNSTATTPTTIAPTTTAVPTTTSAATTDVPTTEAPTTLPPASGDVTVFAASSLTAAFTEIGDAFMAQNPDAKVTFNFAASSDLVTQIGQGAPADVFASADQSNMKKLTDAGDNATEPVVFATNLLEIIVGPSNPKGITGVADLANANLAVVMCAPEVPCGKYAAQILESAGVTVTPKSLEENVKAVVTKVTLGEADAGIVYETDVTAAGDKAAGVKIPADINVLAEYPIAVTKEAPNAGAAQAFVDFVASDAGQAILASYGFLAP
jgi:molybdate transport system substrate-binding protein